MTTPTQPQTPEANPLAGVDFSDHRGGNFFVLDGKRVHESDLTPAQHAVVFPAPITSAEPAAPAVTNA